MMTTYIGPRLYPGALTDCAASVLRTISSAGVWIPDFSAVSYDQQKAILLLRNTGYIEMAAYVGWKVKGNMHTVTPAQQTPAAQIAAIREHLRQAGVDVDRIRTILPTTGAWKRPGQGAQWTVVFNGTVRLNGARLDTFASDVIVDGSLLILRLNEGVDPTI